MRRHKTKKRVPLTAGNLVIDLPIPERLVLPKRGTEEMTSTRLVDLQPCVLQACLTDVPN